jgi:pilus assembly protein CpaB
LTITVESDFRRAKQRVSQLGENMRATRVIVLGLAAGSALTAAYLANNFLDEPGTEIAETKKVETGEILVASRDIAVGDRIEETALSWTSWPANQISPTMISRAANPDAKTKLSNGRARIPMFNGEPVHEKKIVQPNDGGFMAAILPKGRRAISVRISAETGAGGFILPNDRVDVILTRKLAGGSSGERQLSETVLSNVRVLAIDQTFKQDEKGEQVVVGKTATLELELAQAEVVAMAESSGQLSLALRSIAESDNTDLGDDAPLLSEKFARGSSGSEITISRWGVKSYTTGSK